MQRFGRAGMRAVMLPMCVEKIRSKIEYQKPEIAFFLPVLGLCQRAVAYCAAGFVVAFGQGAGESEFSAAVYHSGADERNGRL